MAATPVRHTPWLIAGLVVLLAAAVWVALVRDRTVTIDTTTLYPELAARIADVDTVRIRRAGNEVAVELKRDGERWRVQQRDGYPGEVGRIGVLIQDIAELRVLEEKTSVSSNYPELGVEDVSAPSAGGTQVEILAGETPLAELIVGKAAAGMQATYVRKAGETASWMVNSLRVSANPAEWIEPNVLHVDTDRVQQATLQIGRERPRIATKATRATTDFAVTGLGPGQKLRSAAAANGVAAGLIALQADDVRRADDNRGPASARATYRTFDGLEVEVQGWIDGDERWIATQARFDAALAARHADEPIPEQGVNLPRRTPEQVQQEVERINNRANGWIYRVAEYKYDGIFMPAERWTES